MVHNGQIYTKKQCTFYEETVHESDIKLFWISNIAEVPVVPIDLPVGNQ
jgi:hypothetical protein